MSDPLDTPMSMRDSNSPATIRDRTPTRGGKEPMKGPFFDPSPENEKEDSEEDGLGWVDAKADGSDFVDKNKYPLYYVMR
jgi:hypothetical protein